MKPSFDFMVHWLFAITFTILTISGLAMTGARFGWILDYNIALADYVHRIVAVVYIGLTFAAVSYEVLQVRQSKSHEWNIFGRQDYGLFTMLTTLLLIISGIVLWKSHENKPAVAFAMFVHEQLTYIAVASVIWHIYRKAHALLWPKQKSDNIMLKPWFKAFIWFITSACFYIIAVMVISIAGPQPSAIQVKLFMSGMMQAMESSLMGLATMDNIGIADITDLSVYLVIQFLLLAFVMGVYLLWKDKKKSHEQS